MAVRKVAKKTAPVPKNVTLPVPAADPELSEGAKRFLKQAQALRVTTADEYEAAGVILQTITDREKEVAAEKANLWDPLAKLTKAVQTLFNPPLKVLEQAKNTVRDTMGKYAMEQENIRREKQRIADQEAEEARQKLLAKAEKAEDAGMYDRAAVIEARAQSVQALEIMRDLPQVSGLKLVPRWEFEVTDAKLVPREYLKIDEQSIRAAVNSSQGTVKIPGVRIKSTLKPQG